MSKLLINTKDTEFEQNRKKYAIIDTSFRDGKPIMLDDVDIETVEPNLQTKEVTITSNTSTVISPDASYDGLSNVTVITNVPSQPATLEEEHGTFIPEEDVVRPTINFTNNHTKAPTYICIADVTSGVVDFCGCLNWTYEDIERDILQDSIINSTSQTPTRGYVITNVRYSRENPSTGTLVTTGSSLPLINPSSSATDTSSSYPRYHATESYFKPGYPNASNATAPFLAGHTYKWKAYWL